MMKEATYNQRNVRKQKQKTQLLYRLLIGGMSRTWGGMQGVRFTQGLYIQYGRNKSFLFFPYTSWMSMKLVNI